MIDPAVIHPSQTASERGSEADAGMRNPQVKRWVCSHCSVEASYLPGFEVPEIPSGWVTEQGEALCLRCRREVAIEQAVERERRNGTPRFEIGLKVRQAALLRFELDRDPSRSNAEIAAAIRCSASAVAKARRQLDEGAAR